MTDQPPPNQQPAPQPGQTPEPRPERYRSAFRVALPVVVTTVVIVVAVAVYLAQRATGEGFEVIIPEAELRERLVEAFPIGRDASGLASAQLLDPRVEIVTGANRVRIEADAEVKVPLQETFTGTAAVSTGLRYDPATASFYLTDAMVDMIEIEGTPMTLADQVDDLILELVRDRLNQIPVYRLQREAFAERAAEAVMRGVRFEDEGLVVTLGM